MLFPRRLCSSDKAPPAPRSSCLCVTPEHPGTGYLLCRASQRLQQHLQGQWHCQHRGQAAGKDLEGLTKYLCGQNCNLAVSRCLYWPCFLGNREDKVWIDDSYRNTQAKGRRGTTMPATGFPCCQRARSFARQLLWLWRGGS